MAKIASFDIFSKVLIQKSAIHALLKTEERNILKGPAGKESLLVNGIMTPVTKKLRYTTFGMSKL